MLSDIFQHWRYFVPRFAGYGLVLGGLFGGLTYPILGAVFGAPYGLIGGLVLGLLMGVGVPIYNRYFAPEDAETYQTKLTFGAAAVVTALTALPLFFIYSLVAGLVTAYITHQYAENPQQLGEKRKHSIDAYQRRDRVFTNVTSAMMHYASYFIAIVVTVAVLGYAALAYFDPFTTVDGFELLLVGVGGVIYGSIVATFIAAINGLFIVMVNRLFFDPEMSKSQYKARLIPLVSVLTLFLSMIVTLGIGAPFAAVVGGLGASKYADWYYEQDEEKAKNEDFSHLTTTDEDSTQEGLLELDNKHLQHYMH